jgi:hypothetical protein
MAYNVQQIPWNSAHYRWGDFNLGADYKQYLLDTYSIDVDGRAIWNHVLTVEVIITPKAAPGGGGIDHREEERRKKIKLIFIMGDVENKEEKLIKNIMHPQIVSDIQNKIQEQLKAKITLSDVQIIKG